MSDLLFGIHGKALELRSQRMGLIASNIANAATPGYKARDIDFAAALAARSGGAGREAAIDAANEQLPALTSFILPGGSEAAAAMHLARAVTRRAERALVSAAAGEAINPLATTYLNRLSDLLFVIARVLARAESGSEVLWRHERDR